jgi:hypothetical protein
LVDIHILKKILALLKDLPYCHDDRAKNNNTNMASKTLGACCAIGFKHEGTPDGEVKSIGDGKSWPFSIKYSD